AAGGPRPFTGAPRVVAGSGGPPKPPPPRPDHPLHALLHRDVAHRGYGLAASLLHEGRRLVRRLLVDVAHHDARALFGEEEGSLATHPHPRAGDQRDLALEPRPHPGQILSKSRTSSQSVTD